MAPVEVEYVPRGVVPVKNLKVVDKALELPLLNSAYSEVTRIASPITPYVESTLSKVTPMVEAGYQTIRSQVEDKVVPHIPQNISQSVSSKVTATMDTVSAAVEKVDCYACCGIDQLTEKVPQLKDDTPKLIEETKVGFVIAMRPVTTLGVQGTITSYFTAAMDYTASFSVAQLTLKAVDSGLDIVEKVLNKAGAGPESIVVSNVRKLHTTANSVRLSGAEKAGTEKAKKLEKSSVMGALMFMLGVPELTAALDSKLSKTLYEDDVSRVESLESEDTDEPVVVDTAKL